MKIGWIRGPQLEMNLLKSGFVVHISWSLTQYESKDSRDESTDARFPDTIPATSIIF
jgi:hypothetical protein